ncbi:MAG TPA: ACT domain-containing protein [Spirochaetota bacterium]|nr:ACT domain-containing protein [Spirochaetota bacterium]HOM37729.1 ACT domain-containing protein [Spirochaetota bacterium]HPQ49687.1 ACT domain-containing protein [Spirochaetota bacterium]
MDKNIAIITVVGQDKKGVIAKVTNYLFKNSINIEDIEQKVIKNLFQMIMKVDISDITISREQLKDGLLKIGKELNMDIKIEFYSKKDKPNVLIMVSKEDHCLEAIISNMKSNNIEINIPLIIGSSSDLKYIADRENISFYVFDNPDRQKNEIAMLEFLKNFDIDLIVLARYMRILSPDFVWRYEHRIINIHPSLLPSFPGAQAYRQAYEKGVRYVGATAHFVTMDLDQGPIIEQVALRINPRMNLDQVKKLGKEAEVKALIRAIKMFLQDNIVVYWNKVYFKD